uniref:Uncharacterized protein n=1 Tax=Oryza brachyantha TaxID=4533 RepID=J3NE84_ORYBR
MMVLSCFLVDGLTVPGSAHLMKFHTKISVTYFISFILTKLANLEIYFAQLYSLF